MRSIRLGSVMAGLLAMALAGCGGGQATKDSPTPGGDKSKDKVEIQRDKLSAEDRALVDAQEWCVISTEQRLGAMGAPIKLEINGKPVFICCEGCKKKAEREPEKTLAKVEELKAKAKTERAN